MYVNIFVATLYPTHNVNKDEWMKFWTGLMFQTLVRWTIVFILPSPLNQNAPQNELTITSFKLHPKSDINILKGNLQVCMSALYEMAACQS